MIAYIKIKHVVVINAGMKKGKIQVMIANTKKNSVM